MSESEPEGGGPGGPGPEAGEAALGGGMDAGPRRGLDFVLDVPLRVTVEIGSARMLVGEVLQLDRGSVIELDRSAAEPADVLVNGRVVARGEVTIVDDALAVRIVEVLGRGNAGFREG